MCKLYKRLVCCLGISKTRWTAVDFHTNFIACHQLTTNQTHLYQLLLSLVQGNSIDAPTMGATGHVNNDAATYADAR